MRVKRRLLRSSSVDDRNDHGTGEVLLTLDIQLRLHDTLRDFARTLEIANEEPEVSEVVELGWHIGVFGAVRIPAKKWGDTEIAERGRSVLVMRARYRSAGLTPHQRGWTDAG